MAPPQILSRSQRRHEQKQTVLVLALVAVVALLSFLAGIMVGRSMSPPPALAAPPPRLPVPPPPAAPAAAPAEAAPASAPVPASAAPATSARVDQLSFYDSLAKGEQPPLGSGINLPPPSAVPPPEPVADVIEKTAPAAITTKTTATTKTTVKSADPPVAKADSKSAGNKSATIPAASKVATKTASKPATKVAAKLAAASYVIQAASYHKAQEAADLSRKLSRKGYTPFVEAVDLGSKGQWHRVYVGPFSTVAAADKVAKRLKSEERLAPVVRKR